MENGRFSDCASSSHYVFSRGIIFRKKDCIDYGDVVKQGLERGRRDSPTKHINLKHRPKSATVVFHPTLCGRHMSDTSSGFML